MSSTPSRDECILRMAMRMRVGMLHNAAHTSPDRYADIWHEQTALWLRTQCVHAATAAYDELMSILPARVGIGRASLREILDWYEEQERTQIPGTSDQAPAADRPPGEWTLVTYSGRYVLQPTPGDASWDWALNTPHWSGKL